MGRINCQTKKRKIAQSSCNYPINMVEYANYFSEHNRKGMRVYETFI